MNNKNNIEPVNEKLNVKNKENNIKNLIYIIRKDNYSAKLKVNNNLYYNIGDNNGIYKS